jgi:uncharacterized protein YyaL (SSP411 family)
VRVKPAYDGRRGVRATASRRRTRCELARRTGDAAHRRRAEATILRAFASAMAEAPLAHVTLIRAVERLRTLPEAAATAARQGRSAPAATAAKALEQEAYDSVEIDGASGRARTRSGSRSGSS